MDGSVLAVLAADQNNLVTSKIMTSQWLNGSRLQRRENTTLDGKELKPQHLYSNSSYWSPYVSLTTNRENLFKHQDNSSQVIIYSILMTCMCYIVHRYDEEKIDGHHYWGLKS